MMDMKHTALLCCGAGGLAAAWVYVRRGKSRAPCASSFEAFLIDAGVGRREEPPPNSFEAFLRPAAAPHISPLAAQPAAVSQTEAAPDPDAKPVTVLYGTEYGFSREVAERACSMLRAAGFWPRCFDMADLPDGLPALASHQALLVVCSTQGDGVPPTEARAFCDWLAGSDAPQLDSTLLFSVCALGDRAYQHFCRCGRTLDARLEQLGAVRLAARVDVNKEDFGAIDGWLESVTAALHKAPLKTVAELGGSEALAGSAGEGAEQATKRWGKSRPFMARVVEVEGLCTLHDSDDKETVRVELDLGDSGLQYAPGDALGIWPTNCPQAVDELLSLLCAYGSQQVPVPAWHYADRLLPPNSTTMPLRDALARCYDLRQPRPDLLRLLHTRLAAATAAAAEGEQAQAISGGTNHADADAFSAAIGSKGAGKGGKGKGKRSRGRGKANGAQSPMINAKGMQSPNISHVKDKDSAGELNYKGGGTLSITAAAASGPAQRQGVQACLLQQLEALLGDPAAAERYLAPRHVADVLREFGPAELAGDAELAASDLLPTLRQLQPRLYSISSSQLEHASRVQATLAVVRYTSLGRQRLGVCSTFVGERLAVGQQAPVYIHKNPDFRLPADPATPIIMVGPGTGLAPFRSFMQERILAAQASGASFGPCLLYFGCRRRDQDYLYGPLLEGWAAEGKLTLFSAFSREQASKVYVQDRLAASGEQVWSLLQAGGHFYVCGDAGSMAGAVEKQLLSILERGLGQGAAQAQAYLASLTEQGRYQRDVWLS